MISGNKTYRLTGKGDFEKRFIIRIRKRVVQGGGCNSLTTKHNIVKKSSDLLFFKSKSRASQNLLVF